MNIENVERDGNGYLLDRDDWSEELGKAMAAADDVELTDDMWAQIISARTYYEDNGVVPPIRKFAKYVDIDKKVLFKQWNTGPMKPISKYGGLPKPTGCV